MWACLFRWEAEHNLHKLGSLAIQEWLQRELFPEAQPQGAPQMHWIHLSPKVGPIKRLGIEAPHSIRGGGHVVGTTYMSAGIRSSMSRWWSQSELVAQPRKPGGAGGLIPLCPFGYRFQRRFSETCQGLKEGSLFRRPQHTPASG